MLVITEQGLLLGGRYRLVQLIAIGGMGQVWEANDLVLRRPVAVKIMKDELRTASNFLERFRAEARHAGGLSHAGIASVFDYGEQPDAAYLVMELVRGRPLSDLMASGEALSDEAKVSIVRQTANALQAAHDAGVIHRDIKPGNLLVRSDGTVKVTDFGIARALTSAALTDTGQMIGTPAYMSPEQATGGIVNASSDVYSLGVVAYELFAGRPPFVRDSAVALAMAHVHDMPPPMPESVPRSVAQVIESALAKDPLRRPGSAGEFSTRLLSAGAALAAAGAADDTVVMDTAQAAATRTMAMPVAAAPLRAVPPAPAARPGRPALRRRHVPALLFLALMGAVVLGIWAMSGGDDADLTPNSTLGPGTSAVPTSVAATGPPATQTTTPATAAPTTVPETAPTTVETTAPPTDPEPTAAPASGAVAEDEALAFVTDYYERLAAGEYDTTWALLSDKFKKDRDLTYEEYVAYWERYDIELSDLRFVGGKGREGSVQFDARYTTGSTSVEEIDELTLRRQPDGTLMVDDQERV